MRRYWRDAFLGPPDGVKAWEARREVWRAAWFGVGVFETVVAEVGRRVMREVLRCVRVEGRGGCARKRVRTDVERLKGLVEGMRALEGLVGEEFVGGLVFEDEEEMEEGEKIRKKAKRVRRTGGRKGDLLVSFNAVTVMFKGGEEDRLQFWGVTHLYDLPEGLFKTPIMERQVKVFEFLITLEWHWKAARSVLVPSRCVAMGKAITWAIEQRDLVALTALLGLYQKIRRAGNEEALDVHQHLGEGAETGDRVVLEYLGRGFELPRSLIDGLVSLP